MTEQMRKEIEMELTDAFKAYGDDFRFRRRDLSRLDFDTQNYGPIFILADELVWEDRCHYMKCLIPDGVTRTVILHLYEEGDVEAVRIWDN